MLEKSPEARYASCAEVAAELARLITPRGTNVAEAPAPPPSSLEPQASPSRPTGPTRPLRIAGSARTARSVIAPPDRAPRWPIVVGAAVTVLLAAALLRPATPPRAGATVSRSAPPVVASSPPPTPSAARVRLQKQLDELELRLAHPQAGAPVAAADERLAVDLMREAVATPDTPVPPLALNLAAGRVALDGNELMKRARDMSYSFALEADSASARAIERSFAELAEGHIASALAIVELALRAPRSQPTYTGRQAGQAVSLMYSEILRTAITRAQRLRLDTKVTEWSRRYPDRWIVLTLLAERARHLQDPRAGDLGVGAVEAYEREVMLSGDWPGGAAAGWYLLLDLGLSTARGANRERLIELEAAARKRWAERRLEADPFYPQFAKDTAAH